MNREIKFRAWNKIHNKMLQWGNLNNFFNTLNCLSYKHLEVMQYTGLKDKNDKEIYEGDIVKHNGNTTGENKAIIIYKDGCFKTTIWHNEIEIAMSYMDDLYVGTVTDKVEVIGNIYENPNLL